MTQIVDDYAARTRPSRTRGWLHAIDATDTFSPEFVASLADSQVGDTIHLEQEMVDDIAAATDLDPVAAGTRAIDDDSLWGGYGDGVLLFVDIVDSATVTDDEGADYIIRAIHDPRDVYAPAGTPLRNALALLEGDRGIALSHKINECRSAFLEAAGTEPEDIVDHKRRSDDDRITTYRGGIDAAKQALKAAGRNGHFPGSCCHGDDYIAIAARDLIDTVPGWTWEAYERVAHPYARATGQKLHPEDPQW